MSGEKYGASEPLFIDLYPRYDSSGLPLNTGPIRHTDDYQAEEMLRQLRKLATEQPNVLQPTSENVN